MPFGRHDPPEPPPRHAEVLGKAGDDECVVREVQRAPRPVARIEVIGQSKVDLVDDEPAGACRDGGSDPLHLVARHRRSRGIRRRGDDDAASPRVPILLDQARRQLVVRLGTDRNGDRLPFEHADEMAVARIGGIGKQDAVVAVDDQREHQQQRRRRAGRDNHAFGRDVHAVVVRIVARDRRAQRRQTQRRRVEDSAAGDGKLRRGNDRLRRREVRLADLHVDDRAPRRFQRARRGLHLHDVKRLDLGHAGGRRNACIHRKS